MKRHDIPLTAVVGFVLLALLAGCGNAKQKAQDSELQDDAKQRQQPAEKPFVGLSTTDNLEVRAAPYLEAEVLTLFDKDDSFEVLARTEWQVEIHGLKSYWLEVEMSNVTGWAFGGYVRLADNSTELEKVTSDRTYPPPESDGRLSHRGKSSPGTFSAEAFIDNPFANPQVFVPPTSLESLDILQTNLKEPFKFETKEIQNRHNPAVVDKRLFIKTENYYLQYYYVTEKKLYLREVLLIYSTEHELNHGIKLGMTENELISICGSPPQRIKKENIYALVYPGFEMTQVDFSFSKGLLVTIGLWTFLD
jgi:hypothetical protein